MASLDLAAILPQGVWNRLAPIWNGKRRVPLIAGVGLLVTILAVAILWSWDSPYSVLFAGLSGEEGGRALAELQKLSIPYRIAEGGRVILVPSAEVGRARLQLAARGVPKGDGAEWSLLDNERLGVSPFVEQVDYMRALETTLAQTIGRIDGVVSAQVRLALPKQTDFLANSPKPSASVMLSLRPGLQLSAVQVAGIAGLVAASVPGLAQDRVRVIDQSGRVLNPDRKDGLAQVPQQLAITREIEEGYEDSVTALLAPVLGRGNFRVAVAADLDFSKSKESSITYGNGHVLSQDETVRPALAGGVAIGIPGALSNEPPQTPITAAPRTPSRTPLGRGRTPPPAQPQKPAPAPSPDKHQVTNYDIDRTVQVVERPAWMLRSLRVAVLVNPPAGQTMLAGRLKSIESLVQSVIGGGPDRRIAVVSLPFEPSAAAAGKAAFSGWSAPWTAQAEHNAVLALAGLLVLFGGAFPVLSRLRASAAAPPAGGVRAASGLPPGPPLLAGMPQGSRITPFGPSDKPIIDAEAVRVLAVNDPARTAQVIREWMARDRNRLKPAG